MGTLSFVYHYERFESNRKMITLLNLDIPTHDSLTWHYLRFQSVAVFITCVLQLIDASVKAYAYVKLHQHQGWCIRSCFLYSFFFSLSTVISLVVSSFCPMTCLDLSLPLKPVLLVFISVVIYSHSLHFPSFSLSLSLRVSHGRTHPGRDII